MAQAPRPNEKLAKLAYKILNTPKDLRQDNEKKPSRKRIQGWFRDTVVSQ